MRRSLFVLVMVLSISTITMGGCPPPSEGVVGGVVDMVKAAAIGADSLKYDNNQTKYCTDLQATDAAATRFEKKKHDFYYCLNNVLTDATQDTVDAAYYEISQVITDESEAKGVLSCTIKDLKLKIETYVKQAQPHSSNCLAVNNCVTLVKDAIQASINSEPETSDDGYTLAVGKCIFKNDKIDLAIKCFTAGLFPPSP